MKKSGAWLRGEEVVPILSENSLNSDADISEKLWTQPHPFSSCPLTFWGSSSSNLTACFLGTKPYIVCASKVLHVYVCLLLSGVVSILNAEGVSGALNKVFPDEVDASARLDRLIEIS